MSRKPVVTLLSGESRRDASASLVEPGASAGRRREPILLRLPVDGVVFKRLRESEAPQTPGAPT